MKSSAIYIYLLFAVLQAQNTVRAQGPKIDSLKRALTNAKQDTDKVKILLRISTEFESTCLDSAISSSAKAYDISRRVSWAEGIAGAQYDLGIYFDSKGDFKKAIAIEDSAMATFTRYNLKQRLAGVYNVLGNILSEQSQYPQALDYYFKALAIDSIGGNIDKDRLSGVYNNIGLVYEDQGNYSRAEEYYFKALKIYEEINDKDGIATTSSNLGNIYNIQGNYAKALKNHFKSLEIDESIGRGDYLALDYSNIGNCYTCMRDYEKGLDYIIKSMTQSIKVGALSNISNDLGNLGLIFMDAYGNDSTTQSLSYKLGNQQINIKRAVFLDTALTYEQRAITLATANNNKMILANSYKGIGTIFEMKGKYDKAIDAFMNSINIADSLGLVRERMEASQSLAHTLIKAGNYKLGAKYLDDVIVLKDSLFSADKEKQSGKYEAEFDYDKKLLEQHKEQEKADAIQKLITTSITVGLVIVLVFLFLLFKRFRVTSQQKRVIEEQKALVEEKNKEVMDSITYAKRLQDAILPPLNVIKRIFPESFVLYKPKDIVAGDFYWLEKVEDNILVAACDCTGHGVPGAMVSVVCSNALNRTVKEFKITEPGKILDKVRELVLETFSHRDPLGEKSESEVQDGMDMSLASLRPSEGGIEVQWAGAFNSLWYMENGELKEITGDKQPVGKVDNPKPFTTHTLTLSSANGALLYLFTDGYADQFGGPKGKKFKYKQLSDKLKVISDKSMSEQKRLLDEEFETWKGKLEQVDDVLVMGIRI